MAGRQDLHVIRMLEGVEKADRLGLRILRLGLRIHSSQPGLLLGFSQPGGFQLSQPGRLSLRLRACALGSLSLRDARGLGVACANLGK